VGLSTLQIKQGEELVIRPLLFHRIPLMIVTLCGFLLLSPPSRSAALSGPCGGANEVICINPSFSCSPAFGFLDEACQQHCGSSTMFASACSVGGLPCSPGEDAVVCSYVQVE
jgi:hypothetical protein